MLKTLSLDDIRIGDELGTLDYTITEAKMRTYREAVEYPEAHFPTIAAKEYSKLFYNKYGRSMVISAKHEDHYSNPLRPGKRLRTTGHVADKYVRRGRAFVVVETRCVDEDGLEIVRSSHTFLLGGIKAPPGQGS